MNNRSLSNWRSLTPHDAPALIALQQAVYAADGCYAIPLEWDFEKAISESVASRGIPYDDGFLAAAWLRESGGILHLRILAHPDQRELKKSLLEWAESVARERHAPPLRLHDQAVIDAAEAVYTAHGFTRIFAEDVMHHTPRGFFASKDITEESVITNEKVLVDSSYSPSLNSESDQRKSLREGLGGEVALLPWSAETAPLFYAAYTSAFSTRPNFNPPSQAEWIADHAEDDDFRADLSTVALENDVALGFVVSVISTTRNIWGKRGGWIDQVGVIPAARGKNLASNLIFHAMNGMSDVDHILLHVNVNNPNALRLYQHLGFTLVGRRARYEKNLT